MKRTKKKIKLYLKTLKNEIILFNEMIESPKVRI
jgi:hypothetical protein